MVLCNDCLRQLSNELLMEDMCVLYCLEGRENMKDALTREQIVELVGTKNYYAISKVLQKLEILGLIYCGKNGKYFLYYLTDSGKRILSILLPIENLKEENI